MEWYCPGQKRGLQCKNQTLDNWHLLDCICTGDTLPDHMTVTPLIIGCRSSNLVLIVRRLIKVLLAALCMDPYFNLP
jgi:hypothetical protein